MNPIGRVPIPWIGALPLGLRASPEAQGPAFRPEDGARRVLSPVLNKNYGPAAGRDGWNFPSDVFEGDTDLLYNGISLP